MMEERPARMSHVQFNYLKSHAVKNTSSLAYTKICQIGLKMYEPQKKKR